MTQQRTIQKGPLGPGGEQGSEGVGLKRRALASDTLLKELDTAAKKESKQDSFEVRKRRILERCGCL